MNGKQLAVKAVFCLLPADAVSWGIARGAAYV